MTREAIFFLLESSHDRKWTFFTAVLIINMPLQLILSDLAGPQQLHLEFECPEIVDVFQILRCN